MVVGDLIKVAAVIKDGPDLISRRKLAYNGDGQILLRQYEYYESRAWKQGRDEDRTALFNRWGHVWTSEGPLSNPTNVWDYKFGQATLSESRIRQVQNGIPNGTNVPIMMVKP